MEKSALKEFLEEQVERYNHQDFIADDPISIPHLFTKKEDIEIIGLIMATISWGNRKSIIKNGHKLVDIMGHSPFDFVMNASPSELKELQFVHRTFNADDLRFFLRIIKTYYTEGISLEALFSGSSAKERIGHFRDKCLLVPHEQRAEKHLSNPFSGSAAKRLNMYLRWMVRKDKKGVDFGIWDKISMRELMIPLDIHTGNVARKLGLIQRKSNDWRTLEELMAHVREFDAADPCKYDFALFGIGLNKLI